MIIHFKFFYILKNIHMVLFFNIFFINYFIKADQPISGYEFAEPSTQKIQDDEFLNPGYLWVERGKKLWKKMYGRKQKSCQNCHGDLKTMKGVSLNFPSVYKNTNKLINLEQQINICRKEKMQAENFKPEDKDLLSLSVAISNQSKGLKQNLDVDNKNAIWFQLGKELYFKKIGQMGLACNQCHDERVGMNLRAEKVSQGQINGFPAYLLRWSKLVSVHRRIQYCNEQARAKPFKIFSDEYNALQLYLTKRGEGLKIESPSVRK